MRREVLLWCNNDVEIRKERVGEKVLAYSRESRRVLAVLTSMMVSVLCVTQGKQPPPHPSPLPPPPFPPSPYAADSSCRAVWSKTNTPGV